MSFRKVVIAVIGIELIIALAILLHIGENIVPGVSLYKFTPLLGALLGSSLVFFSTLTSAKTVVPWFGYERRGWLLVGCGQLVWGIGESFWRYYTVIGQSTFPSLADIGYAGFPAICFIGLLLQPNSGRKLQRTLVALDSLIAMGALLAISWYLLLGAVALNPDKALLEKFLGLYYPIADASLLSCVVFLLMRGQSALYQVSARKISLFILGLGLCFFAVSDFIFNLQQNANIYMEGTLVDLGWPLGMITIGLAAFVRRFLPSAIRDSEEVHEQKNLSPALTFRSIQFLPYILILVLFIVLILNGIATDPIQQGIRIVLLLATVGVISLVLVRQLLTLRENDRLSDLQARSLLQIEEQSRQIAERNRELEEGISHLRAVQTSLANGNMRARAQLKQGVLWSLANSLNLLAERLVSLGMAKRQLDLLRNALVDLGGSIERFRAGHAFKLPPSCENMPEITPIVHAIGVQKGPPVSPTSQSSVISQRGFPHELPPEDFSPRKKGF
jgi:hypothetical protein